MDRIEQILRDAGGVAHLQLLVRAGASPDSVRRAARRGAVLQVRPGIYASHGAHPDVVRAARVGGRLAGTSAARAMGLWTPDGDLVVEVSRSASRLRHPDDPAAPLPAHGVRVLWSRQARRMRDSLGTVDMMTALRQVVLTEKEEFAVAVLDSALRRSPFTEFDLAVLAESLPRRLRGVVSPADRRAESGSESIVRVLLRRHGIEAIPQVRIPFTDLDRFDLLVGDRLLIECDSDAHHGTGADRLRDLRRDAAAAALGFIVLRFDYRQIMFEPDAVIAAVLGLVGAGLHLDRSARQLDRPACEDGWRR